MYIFSLDVPPQNI